MADLDSPLPSAQKRRAALETRTLRAMSQLNRRFDLLAPDDRVMVCLSGGKDSWAMLYLLAAYRRKLPFDFEIVAVHLDQGQPGHDVNPLRAHLEGSGFEFRIVEADTYGPVVRGTPEGKGYCSLCSRFRRGILYNVADQLGATKLALGHHRDDVIETMLLNLVHAGQLKSMPCKLSSDDGRHTLIRPLAQVAEQQLAEYAELIGVPILPCNLCGSQSGMQRVRMRQLLADLEREQPSVRANMFAALGNIKESHLYDQGLLREVQSADEDGPSDKDEADCAARPTRSGSRPIHFKIL